jgi:hypothetical protein
VSFLHDLDHTDTAWAYDLAHRFLDAAQDCGFECDRTFVADAQYAEGPPVAEGDCHCQLAVVVTPGVSRPRGQRDDDPICVPVFTAEVRLIVDLCVLVPEANEALDPAAVDANAKDVQESLWKIMQGLLRARSNGTLAGSAALDPAGWEQAGDFTGSSRWQTRWYYRS